jgi:hypothetical protein
MKVNDYSEGVEISQKRVAEYLLCLVINCRMIGHPV